MGKKLIYEDMELNFSQIPIRDNIVSAESAYSSAKVKDLLDRKQNALAFDTIPTANSNNPVTSGGIKQTITSEIQAARSQASKVTVGATISDVVFNLVGTTLYITTTTHQ